MKLKTMMGHLVQDGQDGTLVVFQVGVSFQKIGVPENGWFIMEKPIKMNTLGVPLFFGNTQVFFLNAR